MPNKHGEHLNNKFLDNKQEQNRNTRFKYQKENHILLFLFPLQHRKQLNLKKNTFQHFRRREKEKRFQ